MTALDARTKALLDANAAFYDAFATGDIEAMERIWAQRAQIACIHPGWDLLVGREAVIDSWRQILSQPSAPNIAHRNAEPILHGGCALVICQELIVGVILAATNTFVYESNHWRIVMHQASQIAHAAPWQDNPPTDAVH